MAEWLRGMERNFEKEFILAGGHFRGYDNLKEKPWKDSNHIKEQNQTRTEENEKADWRLQWPYNGSSEDYTDGDEMLSY